MKKRKLRGFPVIFVCILGLFTAMRTPGFDDIRTVLFLLIFSSGMCAGVGLFLLINDYRARKAVE